MIKSKNVNILLNQLSTLADKKLPIALNMAIAENILILKSKSELIQENIRKLCERYCERDKNGKIVTEKSTDGERYKLVKDKIPEFNQEYSDLMELEMDINFKKVSPELIEKADNDRYDPLTPGDLICLDVMIEK